MGTKHFTDEQVALCAELMDKGNLAELPVEMRMHLKECDDCAQQVLMVNEISNDIKFEKDSVPIIKSEKNNSNSWLMIAASAAVLVSLGFYLHSFLKSPNINLAHQTADSTYQEADTSTILLPAKVNKAPEKKMANNDKPVEPKNKNREDSTMKKADTELLAYVANEQLEKLAERFQSGALRGDNIEIKSHNVITGKPGAVLLEWVNSEKQLLIFELYNNKGEKLFEDKTNLSSYTLTKTSEPGLYYWKLINEDFDLLYCGKIIIK